MPFLIALLTFAKLLTVSGWLSSDEREAVTSDLTAQCVHGALLTKFLTCGMGRMDSIVVAIAESENPVDCTVVFVTEPMNPRTPNTLIILRFLFSEVSRGDMHICHDTSTSILVSFPEDGGRHITNVCKLALAQNATEDETISFISISAASSVNLEIHTTAIFEMVKVTAVSVQAVRINQSCHTREQVPCFLFGVRLCISKILSCDDYFDCGVIDENDVNYCKTVENLGLRGEPKARSVNKIRDCKNTYARVGTAQLWLVTLIATILLLVLAFFLVNVLRNCMARVAKNFYIFNENQDNRLFVQTIHKAPAAHLRTNIIAVKRPSANDEESLEMYTSPALAKVIDGNKKKVDEYSSRHTMYEESLTDRSDYYDPSMYSEKELGNTLYQESTSIYKLPKHKQSKKKPRFDSEVVDVETRTKTPLAENENKPAKKSSARLSPR